MDIGEAEMKPPWSPSLAVRRRPLRFEQVAGHEAVKAYLEDEVRSRSGRGVILRGPMVFFYTSMSEIYANALLCPNADPSPCLKDECHDCEQFVKGRHRNLISFQSAGMTEVEFAADVNSAAESEQMGGGWLVILIDDAESMSHEFYSIMHDRMERSPGKVTFILCSRLPTTLEKRTTDLFQLFDVSGADLPMRLSILKRLCRLEGVAADDRTLELLARGSSRCVREAIRDWEPLIARGEITDEDVRSCLARNSPTPVANYLTALVQGRTPRLQLAALDDWDTSDDQKVTAIRRVLSDLFVEDVACLRESLVDYLGQPLRQAIVARFAKQADELGFEVRRLWHVAVMNWAPREGLETDLLPFILGKMDDILNGQGSTIDQDEGRIWRQETTIGNEVKKPGLVSTSVRQKPGRSSDSREMSADQGYLSKDDFRKLWNAASFMIQRYNVFINTRIVVDYGRLGISNSPAISKVHRKLRDALRGKVERQAGNAPDPLFHWLYVHESAPSGYERTQYAAHVPSSIGNVADWVISEIERLTVPAFSLRAVRVLHGEECWDRHLKFLRCLCRGLDPQMTVEASRTLIDVVGVRRYLRGPIGRTVMTQTVGVSGSINESSQKASDMLPPLSAFDESRWDNMTSGFEGEEGRYQARLRECLRVRKQDIDFEYRSESGVEWQAKRKIDEQTLLDELLSQADIRKRDRPGFG